MEKLAFLVFCAVIVLTLNSVESKVKRKFGCIRPKEPLYGGFKFNQRMKSLKIVCEEGFELIGTSRFWYCVRGKWEDDLSLTPIKTLDFHDNCSLPFTSSRMCPPLQAPRNGILYTQSRAVDGKAIFRCNPGYIIDGSDERICYPGYIWSGQQPICRSMKTVRDMANLISDELIDKLAGETASSEGGLQSKLAVGKSGLDIIFALDVSSSIGKKSLETAKDFIKLLVKTFGVSKHADGGKNGTRVAFVTFASNANITFNLNDPEVRSVEKAFEKIDSVKSSGGGTNFMRLYSRLYRLYGDIIEDDKDRNEDATRAVFILTDAEATANTHTAEVPWNNLKNKSFEIFTVGVGHTNKFKLSTIASKPYNKHVFMIDDFNELDRIAEIISEKNLDHGQCGVSGNTEIPQDSGDARKDAWPWIGWVNVYDNTSPKIPKTCGGYLVCRRYFVTTASCVSPVTEDGYVMKVDKTKILVTLGDHLLFNKDNNEQQARVADIHIHPSYTGKANEYDVKEYDIALLDFGEDKDKQPIFNKHVRPMCMASDLKSSVYDFSKNHRMHLQQNWKNTIKRGFVTGWGHTVNQTFDLPTNQLTQSKRTIHTNKRCRLMFPNLDTKKFFCVGNVQESKKCKNSDIGGPYMDEIEGLNYNYAVLGITLNTNNCDKSRQYSIFLDTLRKDIVKWLGQFLSDCNRSTTVPPTTVPPTTVPPA